ncbi:ribosomal-protein-alanine acetyltransferase [Mycoplasma sp. CAG:877]|jgi:ribosomal-protein-alanine acetyltransferase|nr:ribosomal-protein-alanine acetyltransferase [Mycoplasma sp. CAG:877]
MIETLNFSQNNNSFVDLKELEKELSQNPFGKILVYKKNNRIIAYLYYSEIYERVEINNIEVEEQYRNMGIGTELLKKLTELVQKSISLEVRINNYNAIKLYKKFNFQEKAIRKGYYQGIDGILMVRE